MGAVIFSERFESTPEAACATIGRALAALLKADCVREEDEFSLRLCMEEAFVNAVRHGNRENPDSLVEVEIQAEPGSGCRILVRDEGEGFDPEAIEMAGSESPGGRGVCLIKHYMKDVTYNRETRQLEMVFCRDCAGEGAAHDG